jgi:hypothetical protein
VERWIGGEVDRRRAERRRGGNADRVHTLRSSIAELIADVVAFSFAAAVAGSSDEELEEEEEVSKIDSTSGRKYI